MNKQDLDDLNLPKIERRILLLGDAWDSTRDGIAAVNRALALNLAQYKGTRVFSTVLGSLDKVKAADKNDKVELIASMLGSARALYSQLHSDPESVFPDIETKATKVSFIIGHAPTTAKAALHLRDNLYPNAKVILFYHVIPRDVEWLNDSLPYPFPDDNDLVAMAEQADVVYSVTDRCHWYYTAKFRNRAKKPIDHRKFYPQSPEKVFEIKRSADSKSKSVKILALCDGGDPEVWLGTDISVCAASKLAPVLKSKGMELECIKIAGLSSWGVEVCEKKIAEFQNPNNIKIEVCSYKNVDEMYADLTEFTLCLIPSRAEPFGAVGLAAMSAGIPTLITEESGVASIISRLTSEPEFFTVSVTPTQHAYRQDGSMWRDRAMDMLQNLGTAQERAKQLSMALRRDEFTKQTHDNFISYCLGGIELLHDAEHIEMLMIEDEDKELLKLTEFNQFLTSVMKQCWRLKHHPLTQQHDLFQLIPGIKLPINELVAQVTDKIEEMDRKIVGVNEETGAFIVYCPTPQALQDLWSRCDVINEVLQGILFRGNRPCPLIRSFGFEHTKLRTSIKGPQFLSYKKELMRNLIL